MIPTIFAGNTGRTQSDIDDKRKQLAYAMLEQGMDASPVQFPWQGAARLAQALMGGLEIRQQNQARQAAVAKDPAAPTGVPATPSGAPAIPPAKPFGFLSSLFGSQRNVP